LPADGHDDRDAGLIEPLERRGVDVPAVGVVLGTESVEQVDRMRTATLEFDADIAPHRRRRHVEELDRQPVA
jgi:hypothetical protein